MFKLYDFFTDRSKAVLHLWILFGIYNSCLSLLGCLVCSLQPCDHLLGKGWPLSSLVWNVFWCFCHFPIWCPRSGHVLSSFAIILTRKRELVALLLLSFGCLVTVNVLWFFLTVLWVGLQCAIVVCPDHTHFLLVDCIDSWSLPSSLLQQRKPIFDC